MNRSYLELYLKAAQVAFLWTLMAARLLPKALQELGLADEGAAQPRFEIVKVWDEGEEKR